MKMLGIIPPGSDLKSYLIFQFEIRSLAVLSPGRL
jgi:hypothetical protein